MQAAVHHVNVTVPRSVEADTKHFYGVVMGMTEVPKPESSRGRGGAWYQLGPVQLHLSANRETFQAAYFFEVFRRLGGDVKAVRFPWIESQMLLTDTVVVDLNEKLLVADNYLIHTALQKGAQFLSLAEQVSKKSGRFIRMSPYHGMVVTESLPGKCELSSGAASEKYFSAFEKAMRSDANRDLPWPTWVTEWGLAVSRAAREARDHENA